MSTRKEIIQALKNRNLVATHIEYNRTSASNEIPPWEIDLENGDIIYGDDKEDVLKSIEEYQEHP